MEYAHQRVGRAGRVGERAEDVENGAHAHFLAHRGDVLHRRMVVGREHEAHADGCDALGHLCRGLRSMLAPSASNTSALPDFDDTLRPPCLATVAPAAAATKADGGGDVEGVGGIAAGADDVDEVVVVRHLDLGAQFAHHGRGGGDLADGFLLGAQAGEDGGGHHRRDFAFHDQPHQVQHLVVEDFAMFDGALERFLRGNHLRRLSGNCSAARGRARS